MWRKIAAEMCLCVFVCMYVAHQDALRSVRRCSAKRLMVRTYIYTWTSIYTYTHEHPYIHTHMNIHIYVYTWTSMYINLSVHWLQLCTRITDRHKTRTYLPKAFMCACVHVCMYVAEDSRRDVSMQKSDDSYIHIHMNIHTYIYTWTSIYKYTHEHPYTYKPISALAPAMHPQNRQT